ATDGAVDEQGGVRVEHAEPGIGESVRRLMLADGAVVHSQLGRRRQPSQGRPGVVVHTADSVATDGAVGEYGVSQVVQAETEIGGPWRAALGWTQIRADGAVNHFHRGQDRGGRIFPFPHPWLEAVEYAATFVPIDGAVEEPGSAEVNHAETVTGHC